MKARVMVTTGGTSLRDDIMRLDETGEYAHSHLARLYPEKTYPAG